MIYPSRFPVLCQSKESDVINENRTDCKHLCLETRLSMCFFQYINQMLEKAFVFKSELNAHVTLEGEQVHLDKAYPSWKKNHYKN